MYSRTRCNGDNCPLKSSCKRLKFTTKDVFMIPPFKVENDIVFCYFFVQDNNITNLSNCDNIKLY